MRKFPRRSDYHRGREARMPQNVQNTSWRPRCHRCTIRMLLRYNAWANDRLFSALAALPGKRPAKSSQLSEAGSYAPSVKEANRDCVLLDVSNH